MTQTTTTTTTTEAHATSGRVTGPFEVKVTPQPADDHGDGTILGRMTLDKTFSGELSGVGKGQMLTGGTTTKGSAGYVAVEHVVGTLCGRRGSFVLMHTGVMDRGTPSLVITVVPDSGTDELVGLTGTMNIVREPGKHAYEFDWSLKQAAAGAPDTSAR